MGTLFTDVGWEEVERLVDRIAEAVRPARGTFDRVVAVARGGLVPAALVAARLGVRRIEAVQVRHYDDSERLPRPLLVDEPSRRLDPAEGTPARTLVVDDVLESGATLALLHPFLPEAALAVLAIKDPAARARPDGAVEARLESGARVVGARVAPADRWIVFPWSGRAERVP